MAHESMASVAKRPTRIARAKKRNVMRIYVDADSCPVKDEIYRVAKRYGLEVTLVSGTWLRTPPEPWIRMEVVKDTGGLDAADDWIADRVGNDDIVVTDDIILASRCLQKDCKALSPRGRAFTAESIGDALANRELMANLREVGAMTGGPAGFTKSDRSAFLQQLDNMVNVLRRRSSTPPR
jgi:uncharacterized protein YaiI (UPF0178 family)